MKMKLLMLGIASLGLFGTACNKESCSDSNADNFDSKAARSSNCIYRYVTSIQVSGVPSMRESGVSWDPEGNLPDLKMVFFKNESGHVDVVTNVLTDATGGTLTPPETMFTNGDWQYELVDDDIGSSEMIATGNFNPMKDGSNGTIKITNGSISISFNYVIK